MIPSPLNIATLPSLLTMAAMEIAPDAAETTNQLTENFAELLDAELEPALAAPPQVLVWEGGKAPGNILPSGKIAQDNQVDDAPPEEASSDDAPSLTPTFPDLSAPGNAGQADQNVPIAFMASPAFPVPPLPTMPEGSPPPTIGAADPVPLEAGEASSVTTSVPPETLPETLPEPAPEALPAAVPSTAPPVIAALALSVAPSPMPPPVTPLSPSQAKPAPRTAPVLQHGPVAAPVTPPSPEIALPPATPTQPNVAALSEPWQAIIRSAQTSQAAPARPEISALPEVNETPSTRAADPLEAPRPVARILPAECQNLQLAADLARPLTTIAQAAAAPSSPPDGTVVDFETLVARLSEAREASGALNVRTSVVHGQFGPVTLQLRADGEAMVVTLANHDPEFSRVVVQAANALAVQGEARPDAPPVQAMIANSTGQAPGTPPATPALHGQMAPSDQGQGERPRQGQPPSQQRNAPEEPARQRSSETGTAARQTGLYA